MIPANPAFHALHQAINSSTIENPPANALTPEKIEAIQESTPKIKKNNEEKKIKGLGFGE